MINFDTGISSTYVSPLFPKRGDNVSLSVFTNPNLKITKAKLVVVENSFLNYFEMQKNGNFYSVNIKVLTKELKYYFNFCYENKDGNNTVYLTRFGNQTLLPVFDCAYILKTDLNEPNWISSSTCYQIFPDRFRKGDDKIGAKEGQYNFDGGTVKLMEWNNKPLPYSEGHCLDFYNGDLKGIEDSIEHLKDLFINVVYINPIGSALTTHRYDCNDFFTIDKKLGGDEAYKHLIKTLHKNGIKVITDISINHTGTSNLWFKQAKEGKETSEFYYKTKEGEFVCWYGVKTLPQLNYSSQKLRDIIYRGKNSVMKKFIKKEYGQDGWRLDVANQVGICGKDNFCKEIWQEVRKSVKKENPEAYLVGEDWEDSHEFLQGDMWDATMNYLGSGRIIRRWLGERDWFQGSFNTFPPQIEKPFTGFEIGENLKQAFNSMLGQMLYFQFNLIDSHDTARFHNHKEIFDFSLYAGGIMLLYLLPGMPSVYYGDEIGLDGKIDSPENARYPMQWNKDKWNKTFFELYKNLGNLRKENQELLSFGQYKVLNEDEKLLIFARYNKEKAIILLLNRNDKTSIINLEFFESSNYYNFFTNELGKEQIKLPPKTSTILIIERPFEKK